MADKNDPVVKKVRQRLVDGEITQEQAKQVLDAYRAQQGEQQPKVEPAPEQPPVAAEPPVEQPQVAPSPEPQQQPAEPREPTFMDEARVGQDMFNMARTGALETAGQFVSGALAEPLSGLAGMFGLADSPETGAQAVEATREALTYEPRTPTGQAMSGAVGEKLAPLGQAIESASEATGEAGFRAGGPAAGAAAYALPAAVAEIAGMKGTRSAKRAALQKAVDESGAGILTPEARQELKATGLTDQDIADIARSDPEQLERMARFNRLGVTPTRGDITQRLEDQKLEAQLFETAQDESGASMRQLRRGQTQALVRNVDDLVDEAGVPDDVGNTIKDALRSRKEIVKRDAKAAYEALAEQQGVTDVPVMIGDIPDLPSGADLRSIQRSQPGNVTAFNELLGEFGLNKDPDVLAALQAQGVDPQPLTLANFEDFRKALATVERSDQTGNISRLTGPVRRELDKQVDAMSESLETSGNPNIAELAKQARMNWKAYKEEFDPKSLTNQLIADRPKSVIPQVEASKAYQKIAANSTPIEQVDRLVESLKKEGSKGRRAIADLQSSMMMDVLDSAFKGVTRKVDGQPMISGPAMTKRFAQLDDKARVVFQDNPQALRRFRDVIEASKDITPQNIAVPKGSAGFLMDAFQQMGLLNLSQNIPGANFVIEGLRELGARSANQKAFNKALKARPDLKRTADILATDYPSLATAIGLGPLVTGEDDEPNQNQ